MQRLLSLCGLVLGTVAHHSVPLGQVEVECDQGAMLHAQGPQSRAVNLEHDRKHKDKRLQLKLIPKFIHLYYTRFSASAYVPFSLSKFVVFFEYCYADI